MTLLKHFSFLSVSTVALLLLISGCAAQYNAIPVQTDPRSSLNTSAQLVSSKEGKSSSQSTSKTGSTPDKAVYQKELVLVNAANKIPDDYKLNLTTAFGIRMDKITSAAYTNMWKSALKDGITLWISSGYRSEEKQRSLFSNKVETYIKKGLLRQQAEKEAEKSVARPGYSEHATGLTLDLNGVRDDFDQTKAFQWLSQHAQEYGFILRYPKDKQDITKTKFEPWHYRYVGAEGAQAMKADNLSLEEYLS